jgi:hypothetical protein
MEAARFTFWSLGAAADPNDHDLPNSPSRVERVRKLPEAILLTAGYYASRVELLRELLKPRD